MAGLTYLEEVDDRSPGEAGFTIEDASVNSLYALLQPTLEDLQFSPREILGFVNTKSSDGRIRRYLPYRHPIYSTYFASAIPGVKGVGQTTPQFPSNEGYSTLIGGAPLFKAYEYRIQFKPRRYNVWQNKDIRVVKNNKLYDRFGTEYTYTYATEWWRFTEFFQTPTNNFITAQQGQMVFRNSGIAPDGIPFQDTPRIFMPDSVVKFRWYQVPYRYITSDNSFLTQFIGYINQKDITFLSVGASKTYPAGSLLYMGCNPLDTFPQLDPDTSNLGYNANNLSSSRLCNLELTFLYTVRNRAGQPTFMPGDIGSNKNWIAAGWNLQPWFTTRKFYYVTSYDPDDPTNKDKWFPAFNSIPFELFFTDPDIEGVPKLTP